MGVRASRGRGCWDCAPLAAVPIVTCDTTSPLLPTNLLYLAGLPILLGARALADDYR